MKPRRGAVVLNLAEIQEFSSRLRDVLHEALDQMHLRSDTPIDMDILVIHTQHLTAALILQRTTILRLYHVSLFEVAPRYFIGRWNGVWPTIFIRISMHAMEPSGAWSPQLVGGSVGKQDIPAT